MGVAIVPNKATMEAATRKLKTISDGLAANGVAMRQVSIFLDQWVQRNFQSKGEKAGGWQPYKYGGRLVSKRKATAQSIDGHRWVNGSAVLLQDTGTLRHSFLPFVRSGVAGIGSDLPYSAAHEKGTRDTPKRRLLPTKSDVQVDVKAILDNFVVIKLRSAQ